MFTLDSYPFKITLSVRDCICNLPEIVLPEFPAAARAIIQISIVYASLLVEFANFNSASNCYDSFALRN